MNHAIQRLQKVQNIVAGYAIHKYATKLDVVYLSRLPIKHFLDFCTLKLVHKLGFDDNFPDYLRVEMAVPRRTI